MPSSDNRQITTGIAVKAPAPPKAGNMAGKKVTHVQRVLTDADNYDEIECHLTPEEVERLKEPNPVTGVPVLAGDWTGRATVDDEGNVVAAKFEAADEESKGKRKRASHKAE